MKTKSLFLLAAIILSSLLVPLHLSAQQLSLNGVVSDSDGVLPGVLVRLRNPSGVSRETHTDGQGKYQFQSLMPDAYDVSFTKDNFRTEHLKVSLTGESGTLNATLSLGVLSTVVDVTDIAGKATASRLDVPDTEIPVQVSTISQEVLQLQGVNDMVTALRNASGVSAQRFYGLYEYYTIRGFNQQDVLLVDGMRMEGNRFNTQLNNVQQIEVLKGPNSFLYGGQALGGAINIIRKKPQPTRSYDLYYRGGRFNTQNVGFGATGPLIGDKFLYRVDTSYDHTDGWRGAGSDRFNVSPSLSWQIGDKSHFSLFQSYNRDHFEGDGGLPVSLVQSMPNFDLSRRFSTPYDFGLIHDSQTHVIFDSNLSSTFQFRDSFLFRGTDDQYFITEGVSYDPSLNEIDRYALYFKHHRRPVTNQAEIITRLKFLGLGHTILTGHEVERFSNFTHRTEDGGDFFPPSIDLAHPVDTQTPVTSFPLFQIDYSTALTNAFYWQDQISVTERLKINVGGRFDHYNRVTRTDLWDNGLFDSRGTEKYLTENAYTYRAGLVYGLPANQQVYFSAASSFTPINTIPTVGPPLNPEKGQSYEFGHRWQGFNSRVNTSVAFYHIDRNDVVISRGMGRFDQAGQQSSRGIDADIRGELGHGMQLIANYGYTSPRFDNYVSGGTILTGHRPSFVPKHTANMWLTKTWKSVFASLGARYMGPMFSDTANTFHLGGWTTFAGSVGVTHGPLAWSVNAENLFNRHRYFMGADYEDQIYPGAPINVFTTIKFRFH